MTPIGILYRYTRTDMSSGSFNEPFNINTLSKGNIKITEYSSEETQEVLRVYVQNGMLGFWATAEEMHDLLLVLNYYLNIEAISEIE